MISLRLKSSLYLALIFFVLGCCTVLLLTSNCGSNPRQPTVTAATLLRAQADSLHAYYQATIAELEGRNKGLATELQATKAELKEVKAKTSAKAAEIKKIIHSPGYPAKELLKKSTSAVINREENPERCDSLATLVSSYLAEAEQKDNLYEEQIALQDSLINGKDAIITLQQSESISQSILFRQSLSQLTLIEKDNLKLRKKLKRQRSAGKWLAFGSAVLTGIATHYFNNK
jgi:hypothetical protein